MAETEVCGNCGEKLKSGMFGTNAALDGQRVATINLFSETPTESACNACGDKAYLKAYRSAVSEQRRLTAELERDIGAVPIVSIHSPAGWEYAAVTIVTAQSTTGTGVWSDVTSAFTDLFGTQSNVYNQKLLAGEKLCMNGLRVRALAHGCNAILAADLDYAEVGGTRAMLMVCMTGTAVRLDNTEVLGEDVATTLRRLPDLYTRVQRLASLGLDENIPNYAAG